MESCRRSPEALWDDLWKHSRVEDLQISGEHVETVLFCLKQSRQGICPSGKLCLETGSGTGSISRRLAKEGAKCTLLDASIEALRLSKRIFIREGIDCDLVRASLFHLPFQPQTFDLVWSSGVLEHFPQPEMQTALLEALRVAKTHSSIVTIVPYSRAWLYRIGKILVTRLGHWKYGFERPWTDKAFHSMNPKPTKVFCSAFFTQLDFLPFFGSALKRFLRKALGESYDRANYRYPGYLITAIWENP